MENRRATCILAIGLVCSLTAGCAVRPQVSYGVIKSGDRTASDDFNDTYFLQSSQITVTKTGTQTDSDQQEVDILSITSTPVEYPRFKLGIRDRSSWLGMVKTNVNITKIENTALVKEIGVEVSDKRVDTIKAIGSIISTVIPLVGFAAADAVDASKLPWSTKTYTIIEGDSENADSGNPLALADGVSITFGPLPPDARPIDELPLSTKSDKYISAACRNATISFTYAQNSGGKRKDVRVTRTLKVADPRFYEEASFPTKGKITSHSECGISVVTDKDPGTSSTADVTAALAAQGKAIKDAIDAAKK